MAIGIDFSQLIKRNPLKIKQKMVTISSIKNSSAKDLLANESTVKEMSNGDMFHYLVRSLRPVQLLDWQKQFRDPSKRLRIMMVSLFIPVLYFIGKIFLLGSLNNLWVDFALSVGLGVLMYVAVGWAFYFELKKESWWTVLLYPANYILLVTLFLQAVFFLQEDQTLHAGLLVVILGGVILSLYLLLLAMNIMNVSLFKYLPLMNSAYKFVFVFSVLQVILAVFVGMTFAQSGLWYLLLAIIFLAITLYTNMIVFLRLNYEVWSSIFLAAGMVIFLIISSSVTLLFLRVQPMIMAFSAGIMTYIVQDLVIHHTRSKFKSIYMWEYVFLLVIYIIVLFGSIFVL